MRSFSNKKKITYHFVGFSVPGNNKLNMKDGEKLNKYLDFTKEIKQLRSIKVVMILILHGDLEKRMGQLDIREIIETNQNTALVK